MILAAVTDTTDVVPDSWVKRVKEALGGEFKRQMSHAVILLAIFEANRIMNACSAWPTLRPYQRKIAILSTAMDLIFTLDFLTEEDKSHIISMTPRKNENAKPIIARIAFNRGQGLEGEIKKKILEGVEGLIGEGKGHGDVCGEFVQNLFEQVTGKSEAHPPLWVYNRRPIFLIYRVYYRGMGLDPNLFEARVLRQVDVPRTKPADLVAYVFGTWSPMNVTEKDSSKGGGVELPLASESEYDDMSVKTESKEKEIIMGVGREAGMPKDRIDENFIGDIALPDGDGLSTEDAKGAPKMKLEPFLNKYRYLHHKQRLQHLMELKLRLDLLNEIGTNDSDDKFVKSAKFHIFVALPHVIPAGAVKNRHLYMKESKLHFEILKDLKSSGIRPRQCAKLMKNVYLAMPPLVGVQDIEFIYKDKKNKAARAATRAERKKKTATDVKFDLNTLLTSNVMETAGVSQIEKKIVPAEAAEVSSDADWHVVDGIEEVSTSIAEIDMTT